MPSNYLLTIDVPTYYLWVPQKPPIVKKCARSASQDRSYTISPCTLHKSLGRTTLVVIRDFSLDYKELQTKFWSENEVLREMDAFIYQLQNVVRPRTEHCYLKHALLTYADVYFAVLTATRAKITYPQSICTWHSLEIYMHFTCMPGKKVGFRNIRYVETINMVVTLCKGDYQNRTISSM